MLLSEFVGVTNILRRLCVGFFGSFSLNCDGGGEGINY